MLLASISNASSVIDWLEYMGHEAVHGVSGGTTDVFAQSRRLLQKADLAVILQLPEPKVQWLIDTKQIRPLFLCEEERFDSREIDRLIDTYNQIAERKDQRVN